MTNPLKISRQSHKNGSVNGGTEVLLFVEKVTRGNHNVYKNLY